MSNKLGKSNYFYKLYRVKGSHGKVTTVSVDAFVALELCKLKKDPKIVSRLAREAAPKWERADGTAPNRSVYVSNVLNAELKRERAIKEAQRAALAL